jgi:hypothetical protein
VTALEIIERRLRLLNEKKLQYRNLVKCYKQLYNGGEDPCSIGWELHHTQQVLEVIRNKRQVVRRLKKDFQARIDGKLEFIDLKGEQLNRERAASNHPQFSGTFFPPGFSSNAGSLPRPAQ